MKLFLLHCNKLMGGVDWLVAVASAMMMRGFVVFLGLLVKLSLAQEPCIPPAGKPNCVCDTPEGTIDLSSLSNTDGSAR